MNLSGGLAFCLAIVFIGITCETIELSQLLSISLAGGFGIYLVIPWSSGVCRDYQSCSDAFQQLATWRYGCSHSRFGFAPLLNHG